MLDLVNKLENYFTKHSYRISYTILFGSRATGIQHGSSDIDVALRPVEEGYRGLLRLLPTIVTDIARVLNVCEKLIDVSIVDPSSKTRKLSFLYSILCEGILVYGDRQQYLEDLVYVSLLYSDYRIELEKTGIIGAYLKNYEEMIEKWIK